MGANDLTVTSDPERPRPPARRWSPFTSIKIHLKSAEISGGRGGMQDLIPGWIQTLDLCIKDYPSYPDWFLPYYEFYQSSNRLLAVGGIISGDYLMKLIGEIIYNGNSDEAKGNSLDEKESDVYRRTTHDLVMIWTLLGPTIRLNRCRTLITNPFCDNPSLFKLSCEDVSISNIYGLFTTIALLTVSIGSMVLTYTKITVVCLMSNSKSLNSKALKTCSTHLFAYLIMLLSGLLLVVLHRFPQYSDQRKMASILFHIIPGCLNPIIYGVQSKEIWKFLSQSFQFKKVLTFKYP
ncbi:olfactory receptor 52A5-like [Etheostoma cragini]|uniref:olfactory receptor 52A5-like n=1 Tax=Etheostoma cragini TaxID=417921 RepID=UPI00155F2686|nr:olfactory receptor 52A5-like [Etheostoma cragini]